jgi:tetratricopeptide (TPR) repeat protein
VSKTRSRTPLGLPAAAFVFAGTLALRLIIISRLSSSPFLLPARGDMHFYSEWARRILEGHYSDGFAFYGLPGYAWLLAFLFKIAGFNPFIPALIQGALDAGTAVLIYKISARVFENKVPFATAPGALAALGWAFFVPAQTYSAILMPTAWAVFVFWFVLWQLLRSNRSPSMTGALLLGGLIGLGATAVATILFLLPLVILAVWLKSPAAVAPRFRAVTTGLLVLGVLASTSPCWLHNYVFARDPVFLSAHSGINLWIGNNPHANGYPRFPPGLRAGQAAMLQDSIDAAESAAHHSLKRGEVSRYWSARAREYIAQHPGAWLRLLALKCRNFGNAFQYDDLSIITSLREEGVTFPGIYFGLVAALAFPGLVLAWRIAPLSRWITGAIILHLMALLPVFTTERYRLPIVPGLLILAAFGVVRFWENLTSRDFRAALVYTCLLLVSALFVSLPQREPSLWALDAYNSGWQALEAGKLNLAERKLQLARAYVPDNAETNFALGNLRLAQQNPSAATAFYLTTLRLDGLHGGALNNLGVLALNQRHFQAAEDWFQRALLVDARNAKTHFLLARAYAGSGKQQAACAEIDSAIALNPAQAEFQALRHHLVQP